MGKYVILKLNEYFNNTEQTYYYTTSYPMSIAEFIEIEVEERDNYDTDDVNQWIDEYNITDTTELLWVATEPYIAARYEMDPSDWDQAESIYDNNPDDYNVRKIKSSEGIIILDSDDGDSGYLMVMF